MRNKIRLLCIIFICVSILGTMTSIIYADEYTKNNDEMLLENILIEYDQNFIEEKSLIRTIVIAKQCSFSKETATKGVAIVTCCVPQIVDSITSTIILQTYSATSGEYVKATAADAIQNVKNTNRIAQRASFKITNDKKYRVKIVVHVVMDGVITTETFYNYMS